MEWADNNHSVRFFKVRLGQVSLVYRTLLWQDPRTKKYFGGEDTMEWADNNHPVSFLRFKLGKVRLGNVKLVNINRSGQVRLGSVRLGQVGLGYVQVPLGQTSVFQPGFGGAQRFRQNISGFRKISEHPSFAIYIC